MAFVQQIEEIVTAIRALQRGRSRRLAAVTLGVPTALSAERVSAAVRDLLAVAGNEGIEVGTRPSPGSLRVLSVEFERDPASRPATEPQ